MIRPNIEQLLRYVREESDEQESQQIESWMAEDPSNKEYVKTIAKAYFAKKTAENINVRKQNSQKSFDQLKQKLKHRRITLYFKRASQIAAAIAAIIMLSVVVAKTDFINNQVAELHEVTVKANAGMRTDVVLPDGTHIWLNSGSEIKYKIPFDRKTQEIEIAGQAYFDVTHNPDEPFKVNVDKKLAIKVLGTQFNVMAYPEESEIKVLLTKGRVAINDMSNSDFEYFMQVNEEFTYNRSANTYTVANKENTEFYTSWTENKLVFKDTPITELFQQLSHFYDVKITIQDPEIKKYRFTGVFNNKTLPYILNYLEVTSNIKYEQEVINLDSNDRGTKEHFKIYNK